jgi:3-hydroxyisobutyrate dehydrogenase-like beta-hydroxyacid dehydrogenase
MSWPPRAPPPPGPPTRWMSTIAPAVAVQDPQALAEKGVHCLDARGSGGDVGAQQGTLSIMVGGDLAIFDVLGKSVV